MHAKALIQRAVMRPAKLWVAMVMLILTVATVWRCEVFAADSSASAKTPVPAIPGGSLEAHEKAGGHLLERHVGKTAEELKTRLQRDTRISAASSFLDRKSADEAVAAACAANQKKISAWIKGDDDRLVITYSGRKVIGISMSRGSRQPRDATDVRLVLVRDKKFTGGWRILTGYPEM